MLCGRCTARVFEMADGGHVCGTLWIREFVWVCFGQLIPRDFFPVVVGFLRKVPFLGQFLSLPGVSWVGFTNDLISLGGRSDCWTETAARVIWLLGAHNTR